MHTLTDEQLQRIKVEHYNKGREDGANAADARMNDKESLSSSEAVIGFLAWLTTRKEKVILSRSDDIVNALDAFKSFCKANNLPEVRDNYTDYLVIPKEEY